MIPFPMMTLSTTAVDMELMLLYVASLDTSECLLNLVSIQQGIVGLDGGNEYNVTGVAPEASLLAYRVFGCRGSVTDDGALFATLYTWFYLLIHVLP